MRNPLEPRCSHETSSRAHGAADRRADRRGLTAAVGGRQTFGRSSTRGHMYGSNFTPPDDLADRRARVFCRIPYRGRGRGPTVPSNHGRNITRARVPVELVVVYVWATPQGRATGEAVAVVGHRPRRGLAERAGLAGRRAARGVHGMAEEQASVADRRRPRRLSNRIFIGTGGSCMGRSIPAAVVGMASAASRSSSCRFMFEVGRNDSQLYLSC